MRLLLTISLSLCFLPACDLFESSEVAGSKYEHKTAYSYISSREIEKFTWGDSTIKLINMSRKEVFHNTINSGKKKWSQKYFSKKPSEDFYKDSIWLITYNTSNSAYPLAGELAIYFSGDRVNRIVVVK
ncbi:MAG: hypothetical protein ACYTFY_06610 [Planctomycetota bacterium]|jgi:hypothetical protein